MPINSPNKHYIVIAKGDSGATRYYIRPQDEACLKDRKLNFTITVTLPNVQAISPTRQGDLSLHQSISFKGRNAIILPQLQSSLLISL